MHGGGDEVRRTFISGRLARACTSSGQQPAAAAGPPHGGWESSTFAWLPCGSTTTPLVRSSCRGLILRPAARRAAAATMAWTVARRGAGHGGGQRQGKGGGQWDGHGHRVQRRAAAAARAVLQGPQVGLIAVLWGTRCYRAPGAVGHQVLWAWHHAHGAASRGRDAYRLIISGFSL